MPEIDESVAIPDAIKRVLGVDPVSIASKLMEKGTAYALQVFGIALLGLVLFRQDGLNFHGSEFIVAIVAALILALAGAATSVYENKRERDVYDIRIRSYLAAEELSQQRAQRRLDEQQAADLAAAANATAGGAPPPPRPAGEAAGGAPPPPGPAGTG